MLIYLNNFIDMNYTSGTGAKIYINLGDCRDNQLTFRERKFKSFF